MIGTHLRHWWQAKRGGYLPPALWETRAWPTHDPYACTDLACDRCWRYLQAVSAVDPRTRYHLFGLVPVGPRVPPTWSREDLRWPWRFLGWHR